MKILKEGNIPERRKLRGRCYRCEVLFEVNIDEEYVDTEPGGYTQYVWKHSCPTEGCNNYNIHLYPEASWDERNLEV